MASLDVSYPTQLVPLFSSSSIAIPSSPFLASLSHQASCAYLQTSFLATFLPRSQVPLPRLSLSLCFSPPHVNSLIYIASPRNPLPSSTLTLALLFPSIGLSLYLSPSLKHPSAREPSSMDFVCDPPSSSTTTSSSSATPVSRPTVYLPPVASSSYSSSSSSSAASGVAVGVAAMGRSDSPVWGGRGRGRSRSRVSVVTGRLVSGLLTCVFAIVGFFVGAITGAVIGLATESGLFRGAGIGAISGAVFSIDVVDSSLRIWRSRGSGIRSILYVVEIIVSLLNGRLVREKVGPAVQNAVQSQMSAVEAPFHEVLDIFETGGTKGLSRASVDKIPRVVVTAENNVDSSGERLCCSVCLQDLQLGETVRLLPHCRHMFHLPCIDSWLLRHGSCPLCRRDF